MVDDEIDEPRLQQLGDGRKPGLVPCVLEQPETLLTESAEAVRRGLGAVGARPEDRYTGFGRSTRHRQYLVSLSTATGPASTG